MSTVVVFNTLLSLFFNSIASGYMYGKRKHCGCAFFIPKFFYVYACLVAILSFLSFFFLLSSLLLGLID